MNACRSPPSSTAPDMISAVPRPHPALGVALGLVAIVALATLCHLLGYAAPQTEAGYPFTSYFTGCIGWAFVAAYALAAGALGWASRNAWPVAAGMVLPLPLALVTEMVLDPTSHNLLPFEIVLYWLPAFAVAFLSARLGEGLRDRTVRATA